MVIVNCSKILYDYIITNNDKDKKWQEVKLSMYSLQTFFSSSFLFLCREGSYSGSLGWPEWNYSHVLLFLDQTSDISYNRNLKGWHQPDTNWKQNLKNSCDPEGPG